jgi:RNA polymerase sigma-70 factor (ECF subfamily)
MNAFTRPRDLRLPVTIDPAVASSASATSRRIRQNAGAVDVIAAVFTEHRQRLTKLAAKILGCPHSAEDVVQDAYIKAIETAVATQIERPLSYLYQIVRNLAIDHYRRAALENRFFASEDQGALVIDPARLPETIVIDRQCLRILVEALADMPKRTRCAFELYSLGGNTQREVAKLLDVSPTLVNFMIRDALKRCREALAREMQAGGACKSEIGSP